MFYIQFKKFDYRARFVTARMSNHRFKTLKEAQAFLIANGFTPMSDKKRCSCFSGRAFTNAYIYSDHYVDLRKVENPQNLSFF